MEPARSNPVVDQTGEFCTRNQPGDVWFLAGTFRGEASRTCLMPAGRPIVLPVINFYFRKPRDCRDLMETADGTAKLNDTFLTVERIDYERIIFKAPEGNVLGVTRGRKRVIACGLWVRIEPLPAGRHELQIRGESADFETSVDYVLDIFDPPTGPSASVRP